MIKRFDGKVTLVTGGGGSLGEAMVLRFAQEGANIAIGDINKEKITRVKAKVEALGRKALAMKCDVSKADEVEAIVERVIREFEKIDILVNNAGINIPHPLWEFPEDDWDKLINVNLKSTYLMCKTVVSYMMERKYGKIINISSKSGGKTGSLWASGYCASKAGVVGFTQSVALDLAPYNINVNAVCPGVIFTPLWDSIASIYAQKNNIPVGKVKEYYISKIPLGRPQTSESIAKVVAFLASEDAADITGQAISVTGGQ